MPADRRAGAETGKQYMMMETVVYAREFLFVKELTTGASWAACSFCMARHQQEMGGWPGYWEGLPPMHYATHCVEPVPGARSSEAEYVVVLRLGADRREADRRNTARRSPSRRPRSNPQFGVVCRERVYAYMGR